MGVEERVALPGVDVDEQQVDVPLQAALAQLDGAAVGYHVNAAITGAAEGLRHCIPEIGEGRLALSRSLRLAREREMVDDDRLRLQMANESQEEPALERPQFGQAHAREGPLQALGSRQIVGRLQRVDRAGAGEIDLLDGWPRLVRGVRRVRTEHVRVKARVEPELARESMTSRHMSSGANGVGPEEDSGAVRRRDGSNVTEAVDPVAGHRAPQKPSGPGSDAGHQRRVDDDAR